MARSDQPIDNRTYHVVVRGEKLAARRGNLDSDLVFGRNERGPCLGDVGLSRHGENKPIDHRPHNFRIRVVIFYRVRIARGINNRRRRSRLWFLRERAGDGAEENRSYLSDRHDNRVYERQAE